VISNLTRSLQTFRLDLLRALVDCGCEVMAAAPDDDPPAVAALAAAGVGFARIPMARAGLSPAADLATLRALLGLIRRWRPDALLPYTTKPIVWGLIAGRIAGVPHRFALVTGLGYAFGAAEPSPKRALVRRVVVLLHRAALRGARRVFVYNEADAADLVDRRMVADPGVLTRVPGTGVNLESFPQRPPPEGPPMFLMVARLLREKGAEDYVEAARRLRARRPDLRFGLLGPLDPNPTALSRAEVEAWAREGVVDYLGETEDVRPFLAAASVVVLPSWYREGAPRVLQEALATGRAVVTTRMPGCDSTVEPGVNGFLVPPRDPDALAAALWRFAERPGLVAEMGAASRRLAADRFDVAAVNRLLLAGMGVERPPPASRPGLRRPVPAQAPP
jgi:glycosyltransferase involved in cell wall biosynthesis